MSTDSDSGEDLFAHEDDGLAPRYLSAPEHRRLITFTEELLTLLLVVIIDETETRRMAWHNAVLSHIVSHDLRSMPYIENPI